VSKAVASECVWDSASEIATLWSYTNQFIIIIIIIIIIIPQVVKIPAVKNYKS